MNDKELRELAGAYRTITIRLSGDFHRRFRDHVQGRGETIQNWVVDAILQKLKKEERE